MSFETLEQRFAARVNSIYGEFKLKDSRGSEPYVEIAPGSAESRSQIKEDSRAVPFVATQRDVTRISRFVKSSRGVQFLAKQTLLQTGNTFAETRLFRPTSVLENVVPFLHTKRATSIGSKIQGILGIQPTQGFLQDSTIRGFTLSGYSRTQKLTGIVRTRLQKLQNQLLSPLAGQLESIRNLPIGTEPFRFNRPEFRIFGEGEAFNPFLADIPPVGVRLTPKNNVVAPSNKAASFQEAVAIFQSHRGYDEASTSTQFYRSTRTPANGKAGYRDVLDSNKVGQGTYVDQVSYASIQRTEVASDVLPFVFTTNGETPIQFRAFIEGLKESVNAEFSERKYLGRTERFVTYAGAKRNVTMTFKIVAFSDLDLESLWLRVNYLTSLAFPKEISTSGFMTPPLFKLTVGDIYSNQPCYLNSLDYTFVDNDITVDQKVSKLIKVNMNISLLEKVTRVYDSPFYGISEQRFAGNQKRPTSVVDTSRINNRPIPTSSQANYSIQRESSIPPVQPDTIRVALPAPPTTVRNNAFREGFTFPELPRPSLDKLENPYPGNSPQRQSLPNIRSRP